MSLSPLRIEVMLEILTHLPDRIILRPVLVAILKDESDIRLELARCRIGAITHLGPDGVEIHGVLDDVEVVGHVVRDGVDGVLEWADETRPEAGAADHALDEAAAEIHVLFGSQDGRGRRDPTAVAAGGIGFMGYHLSDGWLDFGILVRANTKVGCGPSNTLVGISSLLWVSVELMLERLRCRGCAWPGWEITHDNDELAEDFLWE
jgi:hypothetical protein